jgi:hypothetical protein
MVRVSYRIASSDFTVAFSKTSASFGDFLASAYRSMAQILASLKAAGLPFPAPLDGDAVLRIEYDPNSKSAVVAIAGMGDDWQDATPMPFKVPARISLENTILAVDGL